MGRRVGGRDRQTDRQMENGWMDEQMDEQTDGSWMDGWMDYWSEGDAGEGGPRRGVGERYGNICIFPTIFFNFLFICAAENLNRWPIPYSPSSQRVQS